MAWREARNGHRRPWAYIMCQRRRGTARQTTPRRPILACIPTSNIVILPYTRSTTSTPEYSTAAHVLHSSVHTYHEGRMMYSLTSSCDARACDCGVWAPRREGDHSLTSRCKDFAAVDCRGIGCAPGGRRGTVLRTNRTSFTFNSPVRIPSGSSGISSCISSDLRRRLPV